MTKLLHFLIACAGIKASNVNLEIPVKLRALTCTAKSSKLAKSNDDEPVPVEIKFIKVFTYFTPNAPKDDGDCFKFYLALDPKTGNDLLTPIPSDFPLPVGDYIFTYDNRAKNLTHNLVIEDEDKKDVGRTGGPHPLIVARMDLVTLEAGVTLYRFYCQVHDSLPPGVRDPPMDFFVKSSAIGTTLSPWRSTAQSTLFLTKECTTLPLQPYHTSPISFLVHAHKIAIGDTPTSEIRGQHSPIHTSGSGCWFIIVTG